jgi:hypothetical protein
MEYATDKETTIMVNGENRIVSVSRLTYEAACAIARQPEEASVMWAADGRHGILIKGESIPVEEGLRLSVIVTGNS